MLPQGCESQQAGRPGENTVQSITSFVARARFPFEQYQGYVVGGGLVGLGVLVGGAVLVNVARGTFVRGVHVKSRKGVGVLVGARVGVNVGVMDGRAVTVVVGVGAVDEGNGPSSACDVNATAVRVRSAFCPAFARSGG